MIKLDDFLTKKKEPTQVLDLSKVKITCKEEFKKYLDKIPECKVKPEKIIPENVKIKDKEYSFIAGKREEKQTREWNYPDPTPPDMKGARLEDLCPVNIDWKMLTTLRPKTKVEEDMFSRLVQLGKLNLKHQQSLQKDKSTDWVRKTKNPKSSILEVRVLSCKECGEDFCDSSMCSKLMYDNFFRPQPTSTGPSQNLLLAAEHGEAKDKKKKKKKKKRRKFRKDGQIKERRKKLGKNSIFNRPPRQGCNRDHFRRSAEVLVKPRRKALSSTRSFSTERKRTGFFEERSKSAPRIHFDCDILCSKTRYEYTSDSCQSHTNYSSQSDSDSPDYRERFTTSRLRLSGRRKLLSARVGFNRMQQKGSREESQFVRRCTLYKGYHSDASLIYSHNDDDDDDDSSSSSSMECLRSKLPEKSFSNPCTSKYTSIIKIQLDQSFPSSRIKFPEKMVLPNRISSQSKNTNRLSKQDQVKVTESFSKIDLDFNRDSVMADTMSFQKSKTGPTYHISRSRTPLKLAKFSGPYLKAKGLFEKKSD